MGLSRKFNSGVTVLHAEKVYGGDINETFILTANTGNFFIKINDGAADNMFEREYDGLKLLKQTNSLYVPMPLLYGKEGSTDYLIMEYLSKGKPAPAFWSHFAEKLVLLHQHTQPAFGLDADNFIGTLTQSNKQSKSWALFYAEQRIMPLMRQVYKQKLCTQKDLTKAEKLCARFDRLFPAEPPALLHGDLWSGNYMVQANGLPAVFDPALYYGHREMDIAMTLLFGGYDVRLYDHYDALFPLQQEWRSRVKLCQLYPLLVHLILFGGHYYHHVMEVINHYS